ncbi:MAG: trypsin-like peptidase domain-containing protein [Ruminococcus sp.]|nr:trypsin-like peptidase domain-containing protein [Ruminococcus sp.]
MLDNNNNYDNYENTSSGNNDFKTENKSEDIVNSYEWNKPTTAETTATSSEYRYSYVNGRNRNAEHNPNRYNSNPYLENSATAETTSASNTSAQQYTQNPYAEEANANYTTQPNINYQNFNNQQEYTGYHPNPAGNPQPPKRVKVKKPKKPKKPVTRGGIAVVLVITMLVSGGLGFGGGYIANKMNTTTSGNLTINKVTQNTAENTSANTSAISTTGSIVQKTADSVVEISTESVVTGSFAQQYVQQGAGSGVIISDDGYILTNHHVIDGASTIKVTLRDQTVYEARLIGADESSDIALIKVDAKGLSAATFGDSSQLVVGDYVVAIGNPLGTLGGTVTDGIISALAREVTIENNDMTLLQTNAQVSPGNSGGGLFNANGQLIGIVNAKDSATEVEGIAFAIPINNVLDILSDLKTHGYVTGRVELGMELTDITTKEAAFYYGVNRTGCYVLSVNAGSSAEKAGFYRGDLITKVNGNKVELAEDVKKVLENCEVGDEVTFTIDRRNKSIDISLVLEEYVPNISNFSDNIQQPDYYSQDSGNSIWDEMFGW